MDEYINKNIIRDIIFNGISLDTDDDKLYAMQLLNTVPPADVRPVVRGRWVRINEYDKESNVNCSICNKEFPYIDGVCYLVSGSELPPFCPNCGADMRETEE